MNLLRFLLLVNLIHLSPISRNLSNQDPIDKIYYSSSSGDKGGNFFVLELTKDSYKFKSGSRNILDFETIDTTNSEIWKKLIKINLSEFDKLQRGDSEMEFDGTDTELSIFQKSKKHSIVNGDWNKSQSVNSFKKILDEEISKIRRKIGVKTCR